MSDNKNDVTCHICGDPSDHVKSFDGDGKPFIEYVACKKFVQMKEIKFCLKKDFAINVKSGVKWNSEHQCEKRYLCNQNYMKNDKHEMRKACACMWIPCY